MWRRAYLAAEDDDLRDLAGLLLAEEMVDEVLAEVTDAGERDGLDTGHDV